VSRSGRGGEERGARMSAVELVGGVTPFYRVRERGEVAGRVVIAAVVRFQGGGQLRKGRRRGGGTG
jgi:hypothetical protein